jgi:predicted  nucleic acid-binding Zn ribbon protein
MTWLCPYDGAELGARTSPRLGQQRQCPKCAKTWTLKGDPVPPSMHHRLKAVKA